LKNQHGQTLVQVMIAAAIMGVIAMAFASMIVAETRQNRGLAEKLAAMDFQQQLTRTFADGSLCTSLLAPTGAPVTFNLPSGGGNLATPLSLNLAFTSVPISASSPKTPLVTASTVVSPISPTLFAAAAPSTFQVTNIIGANNGTTGTFTASFQVNFDQTKLVQPLRPATTQISLQTTGGAVGTQTITGCTSASGPPNSVTCSCPSSVTAANGQVTFTGPPAAIAFYLSAVQNGYAMYGPQMLGEVPSAGTHNGKCTSIPGASMSGNTISGSGNSKGQTIGSTSFTLPSTLSCALVPNLPLGPFGIVAPLGYNNSQLDPNSDVLYQPPTVVGNPPTKNGCSCPGTLP
jgi:hypothetical protein